MYIPGGKVISFLLPLYSPLVYLPLFIRFIRFHLFFIILAFIKQSVHEEGVGFGIR